jgi:glucokinase
MTSARHLGLDLGGTQLKWAVVSSADGIWDRVATDLVPTRVDAGADGIIEQLAETAAAAGANWGPIASVGVGIPGRYDAAGGRVVMTPNIPVRWEGTHLVARLEPILGVPVHLINDARAFTLAELRLGAGRGAQTVVGMTLGTGVGGGLAIHGALYLGLDGAAGEIGHQTIDPDGPLCNCGNRGCVEAFARADVIAATCGTTTVEEAVHAAAAGDVRALDGLAQVGRYLGIGIANIVTVLSSSARSSGSGPARSARPSTERRPGRAPRHEPDQGGSRTDGRRRDRARAPRPRRPRPGGARGRGGRPDRGGRG